MKKKWIIAPAIFIVVLFSFFYNDITDYSGAWVFVENDSSLVFNLTITQDGSTLKGNHCATFYGGLKMDCVVYDDDMPSIKGTANATDSIVVTFKSSFSQNTGQATIKKISASQIQWIITQKPAAEFHIPSNVILTKE